MIQCTNCGQFSNAMTYCSNCGIIFQQSYPLYEAPAAVGYDAAVWQQPYYSPPAPQPYAPPSAYQPYAAQAAPQGYDPPVLQPPPAPPASSQGEWNETEEEMYPEQQVPESTEAALNLALDLLKTPTALEIVTYVILGMLMLSVLLVFKSAGVAFCLFTLATIAACFIPKATMAQINRCDERVINPARSREILRTVEQLFDRMGWVGAFGGGDLNRRMSKLGGWKLGPVVSVKIMVDNNGEQVLAVWIGDYVTARSGYPKWADKAIRVKQVIVSIAERCGQ